MLVEASGDSGESAVNSGAIVGVGGNVEVDAETGAPDWLAGNNPDAFISGYPRQLADTAAVTKPAPVQNSSPPSALSPFGQVVPDIPLLDADLIDNALEKTGKNTLADKQPAPVFDLESTFQLTDVLNLSQELPSTNWEDTFSDLFATV